MSTSQEMKALHDAKRKAWLNKRRVLPHLRPLGNEVSASEVYNYLYLKGTLLPPNFPMPALLQDSQSNLGLRWSNWLDDDRLSGHKY